MDNAKEIRDSLISAKGVEYKARFIPKEQPEEKYPRLHWEVTLSRGNWRLTTPYTEGCGHAVVEEEKRPPTRSDRERAVRAACETGKIPRMCWSGYVLTKKPQPTPKLDDVLYCLVMDSDALDSTFSQWADEYGYSSDSIKAKEIYDSCIQTGIKLRQLFTCEEFAQLRETFQDY